MIVPSTRLRLASKGILGPAVVLLVLLIIYAIIHPSFLTKSQITTLFNESTVIALAAVGEAIVVLLGGFDLSVGSALSVINVLLVVHMGHQTGSEILWIVAALAVGAGIGLLNGLLIAVLRIPSIVATLATSFFWGGVALLILKQAGGSAPLNFSNWFTGTHAGIPNALVLLVIVTLVWLAVKRTPLGMAIYALGGDQDAAVANGVSRRPNTIAAYTLAGVFYGLSGLFLTAQTSSGDPNVGSPLLLTIFAAVVIGGIAFGGGRGDAAASILGAFVLTVIADVLYAFGVSSFYTSIFNGAVLLVALIASARGGQLLKWVREQRGTAMQGGGPEGEGASPLQAMPAGSPSSGEV